MASGKFVTYYRVSTQRQGRSGLGMEAQRAAVEAFLNGGSWEVVAEFQETETGKGADALSRRPQLREALKVCRRTGATLLIAKLDRLARNTHFVTGLMETGCEFVAADMPQANKVMIQMHAVMSEWERDQISARTKAALAAAKARGVKLGLSGPTNLRPNLLARREKADAIARKIGYTLDLLHEQKLSQRAMVKRLNEMGIAAPCGGSWSLIQLQRVMKRVAQLPPNQECR